ncbi:GH24393 [Drosophila grimshawi]|uniref:GH24393 n=2 Tax=Drosophila grimshawi TaxID=7222 RepID=B4JM55_DROGR|nr:GH24393 [Drosophila grimshawi]
MSIEEMMEMEAVLKLSVDSEWPEMQCALLKSEIEYKLMHNSSMIDHPPEAENTTATATATETETATETATTSNCPSNLEPDYDGPSTSRGRLTALAQVHHELNWSPEREQRPLRKRKSNGADNIDANNKKKK